MLDSAQSRQPRTFAIGRLLSLLVGTTTGLALLITCAVFIGHDYTVRRETLIDDLKSLAAIVAGNAETHLLTGDTRGANAILRSLATKPSIDCAAVYRSGSQAFAVYQRDEGRCGRPPTEMLEGARIDAEGLHFVHRIEGRSSALGTVYLRLDRDELTGHRGTYALAAGTTIIVAFCLVVFLSGNVQQSLTAPLLQLAAVARKVSRDHDYDSRVRNESQISELRALVDGFNSMLTAVKLRDQELERRYEQIAGEVIRRTDSEGRTKAILETAVDGILTVDSEARIESANPAAVSMFGLGIENLIGADLRERIPDAETFTQLLDAGDSGKPEPVRECDAVRGDGESFPAELSISPLRQGKRRVLTVMVRDISERRSAEREKANLEDQVRQSQKMEAIGVLAGGVAHDFNNLLVSVQGNADLAMDFAESNEELRTNLSRIMEASDRARDLIAQLMAFSRHQDTQHGPMDIGTVVKSAVALVRASIPATIDVRSTIDADCGNVMGDAAQIQGIVINLCTNAYHAIGEESGGCIEVRLCKPDSAANDERTTADAPRYVQLTVSDDGCGMDAETQERIFEPFYTTKGVGKGTGLGLAVVHGTVGSHGGTIRVESIPGSGTTFVIQLPSCEQEIVEAVETSQNLPIGNEKVLVVDDEPTVRDTTAAILQRLGYRTLVADTGAAALELLARERDPFALIVTDHAMPGMTGLELAHEIRARSIAVRMVLLTAYRAAVTDERLQEAGFRACLAKPFTRADLAVTVRAAIDDADSEGAGATSSS